MEVFLVPVGRGRYALYCEPADEPERMASTENRGFWKRMTDRFSEVLTHVEREHGSRTGQAPPSGAWARLRARVMAWMAEKIAEQRLLWRLRGCSHVRTLFPAGLDRDRTLAIVRGNLSREWDRHRWWLVIDVIGGLVALALTPIPGPNLIGYYFTFRIVGHFLALRGARHGLAAVRWDLEPSDALADLEGLETIPAAEREQRVLAAAERLGLPRLATFYERAASWSA